MTRHLDYTAVNNTAVLSMTVLYQLQKCFEVICDKLIDSCLDQYEKACT